MVTGNFSNHVFYYGTDRRVTMKIKQSVARAVKKRKKKRRGKNLLRYFIEYE